LGIDAIREGVPASIHTEVAILGAIMLDPLALADARARLVAGDFILDSHQRVYRAILAVGEGADFTTVRAELERRREMDAIGGINYLLSLTEGIPRNFNIQAYVEIVLQKAMLRRVMQICHDGQVRAQDESEDAYEVADWITKQLTEERPEQSVSVFDAMPKALKSLDESAGNVISTGIRELDDFTSGGMRTKELWIIGALPSRGKSSLARQLERGALWAGVPVHTHTIEMGNNEWLNYHAAVVGGVPAWKLRTPYAMPVMDRHNMNVGGATVQNWPFLLDDCGQVHINTLLAKSRLSVMRHGTKVVVVDYLQMLDGDEKEKRNQMGTAAKKLKQFAKVHDCCVVALSQLARRGDINARPTMQDLKESGDLEAAGDVILLNYMPVDDGHFTGDDEIIIAKQRHGAIGSIPMRYDKETLTFRAR
jgi:replicative DNA helicase